MAHFAEIDKDNKVIRVIVVNNEVITDEDGQEQEQLGIDFCKSLYGEETAWVQTSYNANSKGLYAGVATHYDPEKTEFVNPSITKLTPEPEKPVVSVTVDKDGNVIPDTVTGS